MPLINFFNGINRNEEVQCKITSKVAPSTPNKPSCLRNIEECEIIDFQLLAFKQDRVDGSRDAAEKKEMSRTIRFDLTIERSAGRSTENCLKI